MQEYVVQGAPHRHKLAVHIVPLQNSKEKSNDKKATGTSTKEADISETEETDGGELPLPEVSASASLFDLTVEL